MANPSVTYTFSNATTADATQVNQNFTDLINSLIDGSKTLSIAGISVGAFTCTGAITLSSATIASGIPVGANTSYDFGGSTTGMRSYYVGGSGSFTTRILGGANSASWTFTLPPDAGTAHYLLRTDGSGTATWIAPAKGLSSSSGAFSGTNTTGSPGTAITNLSVAITCTGRDVEISLLPDGTASTCYIANTAGSIALFYFLKDGVAIGNVRIAEGTGTTGPILPASSIRFIDQAPAAGSHTYSLRYQSGGGGLVYIENCKLSVREMF